MGLRFVEYRRRQWVLRYRDPWSGQAAHQELFD